MKEKIRKFFEENRAQIMLFVIILLMTIIPGCITSAFASPLASVVVSAAFGTLTLTGLYSTASRIGFGLPQDKLFGIAAIFAGIFIVLAA